jgi:hypothetical protein
VLLRSARIAMQDLAMIAVVAGFFVVAWAYALACERI